VLAGKYEVLERLGKGWEGEVYRIEEITTGVERAAKFFYPHRNLKDSTMKFHARKLARLHQCPILIRYVTHEAVRFRGHTVKFLVSELFEGERLDHFLARQPKKRLSVYEGLHLLHALAGGLEQIHEVGEYHGDLHSGNIMVQRSGITFDVKLVDLYRWHGTAVENIREDVFDVIRVFYDLIGGQKAYAKHPPEVKWIVAGLKRTLIQRRFRTAGDLRYHLETMEWDSM
jgi:hypothetical protein